MQELRNLVYSHVSKTDQLRVKQLAASVDQRVASSLLNVSITQVEQPNSSDCISQVFGSEFDHAEFREKHFFLVIIPALITIIILTALEARSQSPKYHGWRRARLSVPIYFLCEQKHRGSLVMGFGVASFLLVGLILGDIPFGWQYPQQMQALVTLSMTVFVALLLYPILASLSASRTASLLVGSAYCWTLGVMLVLHEMPCKTYDKHTLVHTCLLYVPLMLCWLFVAFSLPYRVIRSMVKHKPSYAQHEEYETEQLLMHNEYQQRHVKELLRSADSSKKTTASQTLRSRLASVPGFRYSISILLGIWISVIITYMLTIYVIMTYYKLKVSVVKHIVDRYDVSFRISNLIHPNPKETAAEQELRRAAIFLEITYWSNTIEIIGIASVIFVFIFNCSSLLFAFRCYRRHMLCLYMGMFKGIPRYRQTWSATDLLTQSVRYIGFQLAYSTWGFIIQAVVLSYLLSVITCFITFVFRYECWWLGELALSKIWKTLGPTLILVIVIAFGQKLIVYLFFLQRNNDGNRILALNNRRAFFNFNYFLVFANTPLGLASCFMRIIKSAFVGLWLLPRIDVSTMPRQFEKFDSGFASYVCMVSVEAAHTNPVMIVFCSILLRSLKTSRLAASSHESPFHDSITNDEKVLPQRIFVPSENKAKIMPLSLDTPRRKVVRNRWHLAVMLSRNPVLRIYRKTTDKMNSGETRKVSDSQVSRTSSVSIRSESITGATDTTSETTVGSKKSLVAEGYSIQFMVNKG